MTDPGTPADNQTKVALGMLRSEAKTWDQAAARLEPPSRKVGELALTAEDVSTPAADRGVLRNYQKAQELVASLLQQGAGNFRNISDALVHSADEYQRTEEVNVHNLHKAFGDH